MPQTGKMTINGKDAYTTWKAYPLSGCVESLISPPSLKSFISSESRIQHGKKVIRVDSNGNSLAKIASRDVTITVAISETTPSLLRASVDSLISELMECRTELKISNLPGVVYRLDYVSCTQFSQTEGLGKFAIKFTEPDPTDRSES